MLTIDEEGMTKANEAKTIKKTAVKVVLRRLPAAMKWEELHRQIDPLPETEFEQFVAADPEEKYSLGRAYFVFKNDEDVMTFRDRFNGYVFVDSQGSESVAVVELAPNQKVPKQKQDEAKSRDRYCGTIRDDVEYKKFEDERENPTKIDVPSMEARVKEVEEKQKTELERAVQETPLTLFLLRKGEEKYKKIQEKRRTVEEQRRARLQRMYEKEQKERLERKEKKILEYHKRLEKSAESAEYRNSKTNKIVEFHNSKLDSAVEFCMSTKGPRQDTSESEKKPLGWQRAEREHLKDEKKRVGCESGSRNDPPVPIKVSARDDGVSSKKAASRRYRGAFENEPEDMDIRETAKTNKHEAVNRVDGSPGDHTKSKKAVARGERTTPLRIITREDREVLKAASRHNRVERQKAASRQERVTSPLEPNDSVCRSERASPARDERTRDDTNVSLRAVQRPVTCAWLPRKLICEAAEAAARDCDFEQNEIETEERAVKSDGVSRRARKSVDAQRESRRASGLDGGAPRSRFHSGADVRRDVSPGRHEERSAIVVRPSRGRGHRGRSERTFYRTGMGRGRQTASRDTGALAAIAEDGEGVTERDGAKKT